MIFRQISLLLVFLFSVSTVLVSMAPGSPNQALATRMPIVKGKDTKKLFKQSCVKCHGADGAGETHQGRVLGATDFTDSEWQERVDDERLENSIIYGRGQMPAFGKKLTPQQIEALVSYLRGLKRE
jgi:mono/diheme cytochrome c family protein